MEDQEFVVFAGEGSSHSWTWLADLFESNGMFDTRFVDAPGLSELLEGSPRAVIVSGGDGLQIAETFRGSVFRKLEEYIRGGGAYIGMCAGAYLPLPSSLPPLNEFNLSTTKVENVGPELGPAMPSPRLAVRYGSCSIVLDEAECLAQSYVCDVETLLPETFLGCYGDLDGNGIVNPGDRGFVSANIGQTGFDQVCREG